MKSKRFPLIAEAKGNSKNLTVCFISERQGYAIKAGTHTKVGDFCDAWTSCFDANSWRIIAEPSEYPKVMYVSDTSEEHALLTKKKRVVVFSQQNGEFYAWVNAETIEEADKAIDTVKWKYAVDIPEISEKEQKRNEILAQIDELYKSIEKL